MLLEYIFLFCAALAAGAINSIAGGGTLLTFPALFHTLHGAGDIANATSSVALFPGSIAGSVAYRREFAGVDRWHYLLLIPSLIGGTVGALLLVMLPSAVFNRLVPFLVLAAALLFALQPTIAKWTGIGLPHGKPGPAGLTGIFAFQLGVGLYGGYFGAGIGILMLSALAMIGMTNVHEMNALKTLLASAVNLMSCIVFIVAGKVEWRLAGVMAVAGILGGFFGAHYARRLDRVLVRRIVTGIGFTLAAWYFYKQFGLTPG